MKNPRVVIQSIIAIGFLVLTFTVHWMFIIGAVILMIQNQRELMKKEVKIKKENDFVRFKGSIGWLIFWIIVFWPVAIYYFLSRRE